MIDTESPEETGLPADAPLVVIRKLSKRYGEFAALTDCSFEIRQGEIFGLLGPNGAGKTTLMRSLLGFIQPSSGAAMIGGFDCWRQRTRVHQLLTYMPAQPQLPRLMQARDVLRFFANVRPNPADQQRAAFERGCALAERLKLDLSRWVALMSTGMRQKLAIAATLCADVPLIFLDEPTANLDPDVRSQLLHELAELRQQGKTIVFSSHVLPEIEQICDRVVVLAAGELVGISKLKELSQGSLLKGRLNEPTLLEASIRQDPEFKCDPTGRFQWQTYQPLEGVLPRLLAAGACDLRIQALGLMDVYRQHLSYSAGAWGTKNKTTTTPTRKNQ